MSLLDNFNEVKINCIYLRGIFQSNVKRFYEVYLYAELTSELQILFLNSNCVAFLGSNFNSNIGAHNSFRFMNLD